MSTKNRLMNSRVMQALVEELAKRNTVTLYSVSGQPVVHLDMRSLQVMLG